MTENELVELWKLVLIGSRIKRRISFNIGRIVIKFS